MPKYCAFIANNVYSTIFDIVNNLIFIVLVYFLFDYGVVYLQNQIYKASTIACKVQSAMIVGVRK